MTNCPDLNKPRLYFAAPLFSDAERHFNAFLADKLRALFDVYLPQEDAGLVSEMVKQGIDADRAFMTVFNLDVIEVRKCDVLLIILDGRGIDEGAAFELGYANAMGKLCIGLQTDPRRSIASRNNPMIDCALQHVFADVEALLQWANTFRASKEHGFEPNRRYQVCSKRPTPR
jgi:nucleoside 2-deoxyribosyltransferase